MQPRDRGRRGGERRADRPRRTSGRSARTAGRAAPTTPASRARQLTGRVLMTVAGGAGRLPPAQLRDGGRAVSARQARPGADGAGRGRRPGGVPQGDPRLRAVVGGDRDPGPGRRGDRRPGRRSPSSTRRGSGRPSPEVAEHLPDGTEPLEKLASRPPRPRASTSAAATRRSSAGSRPTSASTRRSSTCSPRGRGPGRRGRGRLAHRGEQRLGLQKMERAGAVADQRRDGALRAARPRRHRRVQAGAEADPGATRQVSACPATSCSRTAPASTASSAASGRRDHRRGRLQHLDDRLPGGGHRPLLRGPDHHLHLPADRQLRRLRRRRWSPTGSRRAA